MCVPPRPPHPSLTPSHARGPGLKSPRSRQPSQSSASIPARSLATSVRRRKKPSNLFKRKTTSRRWASWGRRREAFCSVCWGCNRVYGSAGSVTLQSRRCCARVLNCYKKVETHNLTQGVISTTLRTPLYLLQARACWQAGVFNCTYVAITQKRSLRGRKIDEKSSEGQARCRHQNVGTRVFYCA